MSHQQPRPSVDGRTSVGPGSLPQLTRPSPSMTPQMSPYQAQSISPAPQYLRQNSFQQTPAATHRTVTPQTPTQPLPLPYAASQQLHPTPALTAAHPTNYTPVIPPVQPYVRPPVQPAQAYPPYGGAVAPPIREQDVFVLPDIANDSIPKSIRDQFPQDSQGRVLFFTKPPVLSDQAIYDTHVASKTKQLTHSEKYLAAKAERDKIIASRKRTNEDQQGRDDRKRVKDHTINGGGDLNGIHSISTKASQVQVDSGSQATKSSEAIDEAIGTNVLDTMHKWIQNMKSQTEIDYKSSYGDKWKEFLQEDQLRGEERARKEEQKQKGRDEILARCNNSPIYDTNISRNIWASGFRGERY